MKKTTALLIILACLCVVGFFVLYWKPWRAAKHRWTFRPHPTRPDMEEVIRKVRGEREGLSFEERVHYVRELERVKHSYRTGAGRTGFDELYPHGALADRVRNWLDTETILRQKYQVIITKEMLQGELDQIERATLDRRKLERYKQALNRDPYLLREILAKPRLVEERMRQSFLVDRSVQEEPHRRAKALRRGLDASNFRERAGRLYARLTFWLGKGRSPEPGMLIPSGRMRTVLTKILKEPGEMTGVLRQETSFQILVLVSREDGVVKVDAITVRKVAFDEWFAKERSLLRIQKEIKGRP